jgi:DNA polymerase IIIc chi subunit
MHDQHERQMARLRVLFDAGEKRNAECKQQIADLLRSEAALMEERKEAVFKAEKSSMELERATKALDEARETIKQLRSREWGASSSHAGSGS